MVAQGTKLTFLPYVVKALAVAMKKFPVLNASIDDASQEIVYKNYINIKISLLCTHSKINKITYIFHHL